jgi:hypothetical protein
LLGGGVLREGGGNREQKDKGDDRSRKPDPGIVPDGAARERAVSGVGKQRWDKINIPAHAKSWKTFLSFYLGELLQVAENLLLAIPDDTIPIYCLPHVHSRWARSTYDAAAKLSDLLPIGPNPKDLTENCFRPLYQLSVMRIAKHADINGNRRHCGYR